MDKWKIVVIVLLLGSLCGYGFFQQNAENASKPDPNTPQATPAPISEKLSSFKGKMPPAWDIAAPLWLNTPSPMSLDSLKGSVSLLEFWRIGCPHCERSAPFLNNLYAKNKARGFKIVAMHSAGNTEDPANPENDWKLVKDKIKEWGITYPVASDEGGKLFKEAYGGTNYPTLIILNRKAEVVFMQTGGDSPEKKAQLTAELEKAFKAK